MKILLHTWVVVLVCFFSTTLQAQNIEFSPLSIAKVPQNIEEFLKMRDGIAKTPQGGAACFLAALLVYSQNSQLGTKMLTISIDREKLVEGTGYNGFQPRLSDLTAMRNVLSQMPDFPHAYLGSSAGTNNVVFDFVKNPPMMGKEGGEEQRVLVRNHTDQQVRMLRLRKDYKGYWQAYDWTNLLEEVKPKK